MGRKFSKIFFQCRDTRLKVVCVDPGDLLLLVVLIKHKIVFDCNYTMFSINNTIFLL